MQNNKFLREIFERIERNWDKVIKNWNYKKWKKFRRFENNYNYLIPIKNGK